MKHQKNSKAFTTILKTISCLARKMKLILCRLASIVYCVAKKIGARILKPLLCPSLLFDNSAKSVCGSRIAVFSLICIFAVGGVFFNVRWPFPDYYLFVLIFSGITAIVVLTLRYCYKNMRLLCVDVTSFRPFEKANYFYISQTKSSIIYFLFPLFFVFSFGIGGVVLFSTIELTPTLVWSLTFFAFVVYLSMTAYLQYIRFALYLCLAANNNLLFENIMSIDKKDIPPKLPWLVKLTRVSHVFRNMFFLVGALYIIAFAGFCFWGSFGVNINAAFFYILWGIIFIFIVIVFPVVTIMNFINVKRIVAKTKESYINELVLDDLQIPPDSSSEAKLFLMLRKYCVYVISNTPDYPIKGGLTITYSVLATILNLAASIVTILQYHHSL